MARVIVLDASVLIGHLDPADAHHSSVNALLRATADASLTASVISLAEALVAPVGAGQQSVAQAAFDDLGIAPIALPAGAEPELALLHHETGLRMPDCCVLHTALTTGADTVATVDARLARAARQRGMDVAPT